MVNCAKCGKKLEDDAEFCSTCGSPIKPAQEGDKSSLEQNIEHVAEEMEQLGKKAGKTIEKTVKTVGTDGAEAGKKASVKAKQVGKSIEKGMDDFGKRMDAKGKAIESWHDRHLGFFGPLFSSLISFVIFIIIIKILGYFGRDHQYMANLSVFFSKYLVIIFLLMVLSAYTSYLNRKHHWWFRWIAPIASAIGFYGGFWFALNIVDIINDSAQIQIIDTLIDLGFLLIPFIAVLVLLAGYIGIFVSSSCKKVAPAVEKKDVKKPSKEHVETQEELGYKRLYRSGKEKILAGICGGLAEYFTVDPVIMRILWVIGLFVSMGWIILAYFIMWIIVPRNPNHTWK